MTSQSAPLHFTSGPTLVDGIASQGLRIELAASAEERAQLAKLNGLAEVLACQASLLLRAEGRHGVWITGEVRAKLIQTCVVSLEDFEAELTETVDVHCLPEDELEAYRAARLKRVPDPSEDEPEEDEPDLLVNGRVDLGALAAEIFTLGLDPYPKKPEAVFKEPSPPEPDISPFAALQSLHLRKE
jgi:Large ribosomal RNA subunit accumulation protein YceD